MRVFILVLQSDFGGSCEREGGGAVTLESTEIERKREDWQGRVSAVVLPFCGCFLSSLLG